MEAKVFRNKVEFYHFIKSVADKFDLKQSLIANENSFVTTEGKHINSLHFFGFLSNLNKELGMHIEASASKQTPAGYVIVMSDSSAEDKVDEKEEKEEVKHSQPEKETVTEPETVEVVVTEDEEADIIAHAESLYDENAKKESKDKLADFASEKGISLAKNQTFEDMIEQLKGELVQK